MLNYGAPGVYIQDVIKGSQAITQLSSSVGVMIGVTKNGVIGKAQKVSSWTEFLSKYSYGLESPFSEDSYLPLAVYGFFSNGGKELYVCSIKKNSVVASRTATTSGISTKAVSEGVWGNSIKVVVVKNTGYAVENKIFDVTVSIGTVETASFKAVTSENVIKTLEGSTVVRQLLDLTNTSVKTELVEETFNLTGGANGDALEDADYVSALTMLDTLNDVTLVAIPSITSDAVNTAVVNYCNTHKLFPILDTPLYATPEQVITSRKKLDAYTGAMCYPWGIINHPQSNTLEPVPCSGYVMGVYARVIENRGIHKAPAGIDAVVKGFIDLTSQVTITELNDLNLAGVVSVMNRPNAGIVIWGARSLNSTDETMKYVTDGLLNLNIKKSLYNGTQFAVFEPNDVTLKSRVQATCKSFLEGLRTSGALKGKPEEAYYVNVLDASEGQLNIEVGYAPVKPAEFIVIKLAHSIDSQA